MQKKNTVQITLDLENLGLKEIMRKLHEISTEERFYWEMRRARQDSWLNFFFGSLQDEKAEELKSDARNLAMLALETELAQSQQRLTELQSDINDFQAKLKNLHAQKVKVAVQWSAAKAAEDQAAKAERDRKWRETAREQQDKKWQKREEAERAKMRAAWANAVREEAAKAAAAAKAEAARAEAAKAEAAREEAEKAEAMRAEEAIRTANERYNAWKRERTFDKENVSCKHRGWWGKIDGSHECENCHTMVRKYVLSCP